MSTGIYDRKVKAADRIDKFCPDCREVQPVTAFHRNKTRSDGYQSHCTKCMRLRNLVTQRDRWLRNQFGMTLKDYNVLLERQGFGCAICGRKRSQQHKELTIDHDHLTGKIRGILCSACNTGIGNLGDDPIRLRAALTYLEGETSNGR